MVLRHFAASRISWRLPSMWQKSLNVLCRHLLENYVMQAVARALAACSVAPRLLQLRLLTSLHLFTTLLLLRLTLRRQSLRTHPHL